MSSAWTSCSPATIGGSAQPRLPSFPRDGAHRRSLELSYPGRVTPPTWAINGSVETDCAIVAADLPLEEGLRQVVAGSTSAAQVPRLHNQPGLNGLATSGVQGLQNGVFTVAAAQPVNYTVSEVNKLFSSGNKALLRCVIPGSFPCQLSAEPMPGAGQRRFVVVDDNVHKIYGHQIAAYFEHHGVDIKMLPLPTHEANKSFELVYEIARELENFGLNRRKEPIIAIGGGVCLDVAGLAANLFRRNTPIIKIPTTLMAAIDASIGIKTAVNFNKKKNKLGTYSAPLAVFIDRSFLTTLDQRNLSNGAAEMLKMACIKDAELFAILEEYGSSFITSGFQGGVAGTAMRRSIQGMLEELEYNLWEHILCRLVDYGHTFSPEIEMAALASGNELLHGEAVNIDMALTTQIAYMRNLITEDQRNRVFRVMQALRLPFWHTVCNPDMLYKGLEDTTKARDGLQRIPLMEGIGAAKFVDDVTFTEVRSAAAVLRTVAEASTFALSGSQVSSVVPLEKVVCSNTRTASVAAVAM